MIDLNGVYRMIKGPWKGAELFVESTTESDVSFIVAFSAGSKPIRVTIPFLELASNVETFSHERPIEKPEDAEERVNALLSLHPNAQSVYATHWNGFPVSGSIQLSYLDGSARLIVQKLNMTWPTTEGSGHEITTDQSIDASTWNQFHSKIQACQFWSIPYDDGLRFSTREQPKKYFLEGWDGRNYHAVTRQSVNGDASIASACEFLAMIAPDSEFVA